MEELNSIKEEINRLEQAIKENNFGKENAYLINEKIYNKLKNCYGPRSYNKAKNELKENFKFIDNVPSLNSSSKDKISFRLISVKALQTIYNDQNLKHSNPIYYGNNKVIIEFSEQDEHNALLIKDFFNSNYNYEWLEIKNKKDQNEKLYKELIEKDNQKSELEPLPSKQ